MVKLSRFTRKTAATVALTLALIGGLSFNPANTLMSQAATTGTVTASALNVRSGPSTSYDRINTISEGTKITILSTEGDWYKVEVNGKEGYVSSQYVSVNGQTADVSGSTGTVNASALNVRAGIGTSTNVIGLLYEGAKVTILSTESNGWYKIQSGSLTGYVSGEYITLGSSSSGSSSSSDNNVSGQSGTCNVSALNIRKGVGTTTSVIGLLRQGDKVEILSTEGDWYKISADGKTGYVFAEYITVGGSSSSSGSSGSAQEADGKNGKCNVTALNVRSKATTSSSVIGSLSKNMVVEITGTSGDWYQIKTTLNGKSVTGYVFAEYIDLTDEKPSDSNNAGSSETTDKNKGKTGTVTAYALNVRKGAGTNYAVIGSLKEDASVIIQGTSGDWYKITAKINGKSVTGYVSSQYIKIGSSSNSNSGSDTSDASKPSSDATYKEVNETVWATAGVNIRKGAGTNYSIIGSLVKNGSITRIGVGSNGWSKVKYGNSTGYISSEYLTTTNPNPGAESTTGDAVVAFAKQFLGNPYVWGGNDLNTGVDCSGFTQQVFLNFGIQLNRTADAQRSNGRAISLSEAQPGDLVFYGSSGYASHVALYIGNGQVIHASSPSTGIIISNVNYRTPIQVNRVIE